MIDRGAHQLQYGVADMCGLPKKWRSNGRDPYRESEAISKIKISDVNAFLKIKGFVFNEEDKSVIAWINNLSHDELSYLSEKFKEKTGMVLKVKGQASLF